MFHANMTKTTREVGDMWNDYIERVLNNTQTAATQWNKFAAECGDVETFKKAFHLRPTANKNKMRVVSTLKYKPMRGAHIKDTEIAQFLKDLYSQELFKEGLDDNTVEARKALLTEMGFQETSRSEDKDHECNLQAKMISAMPENDELKSFLKADNLTFIASEFILHPDSDKRKGLEGYKVDIIGYDGLGKIFFFELKTPKNKKDNPGKQVIKYLNRYSIEKRDQTIDVLSNYPINSIKISDVEFHGYAVHGYGEKLDIAKSKRFQSIEEPGVIYFLSDKD
jgi:hypothetical protein